jgi:Ca2+-binding EF-hand superfamily protein
MNTRLLAATLIASVPLAGFAAQDERTPDPSTSSSSAAQSASFETLDANQDGRISMPEASADPRLVENFSTADKNGDGYLDAEEYRNSMRSRPQQ